MKKLLLVSSLFLVVAVCAWSCNQKPGSKTKQDELTKEDKVIHHGSEDQAKLDSIKAAKNKAKGNN